MWRSSPRRTDSQRERVASASAPRMRASRTRRRNRRLSVVAMRERLSMATDVKHET